MKNLFLVILMLVTFSFTATSQVINKTLLSDTIREIVYTTKAINQPFSIHTVLSAGTNLTLKSTDTIQQSLFISNDKVNWVAYPSASALTFKSTATNQVTSGTLVYKYLKLRYTLGVNPNDSVVNINVKLFQ